MRTLQPHKVNYFKRMALAGLAAVALGTSCDYQPRNHGQALYDQHCKSCHMDNGEGLGTLYPPLRKADFVVENKESLACIIRHGISGPIMVNGKLYNAEMAGNKQLSDFEVSNLVHYILEEMNEVENNMNVRHIRAQLEDCAPES